MRKKLLSSIAVMLLLTACIDKKEPNESDLLILDMAKLTANLKVLNFFKKDPAYLKKWQGLCKGATNEALCNKFMFSLLVDQQTVLILEDIYGRKSK